MNSVRPKKTTYTSHDGEFAFHLPNRVCVTAPGQNIDHPRKLCKIMDAICELDPREWTALASLLADIIDRERCL